MAAEVRRALEAGQPCEPGPIHVELQSEECGGRRITRLYLDGAPLLEF
jgi:hypothetical protein